MEPKVLILDEPTAGLDPKGRNKILDQIKAYHDKVQNTILLVSPQHGGRGKPRRQGPRHRNEAKVFAYDTVENVFARSDELKSHPAGGASVTNVFHRLRDEGAGPVPKNVYTVGYAKKKILKALEERGCSPLA